MTIPESYYQIDFVCGAAITQFNPSCVNTYHGENRFIQSDNGGCENVPAAFGSVSGTVYKDVNGNKSFGSGDAGIGGVTVKLTGTDASGRKAAESRVTAADGSYSFLGLQPGTYTVAAATPSGYQFETANVGSAGGSASGSSITGIKVAGDTNSTSNNFAEIVTPSICKGQTQTDCFWASCNGQNLIKSFSLTSSGQTLGQWLVSNYKDVFGSYTCQYPGLTSSSARTSDQAVAQLFEDSYNCGWSGPLTEFLATALNVFATTSSLNASSAGVALANKLGFAVTAGGLGNCTFTVSKCDASGAGLWGTSANNAYTVDQILQEADQAVSSSSCNWNWNQIWAFYDIFDSINESGCC